MKFISNIYLLIIAIMVQFMHTVHVLNVPNVHLYGLLGFFLGILTIIYLQKGSLIIFLLKILLKVML